MIKPAMIHESPWDKQIFGIDSYELAEATLENFQFTKNHPGHYTARVHPLASKALLHQFGFYYCDSLLEPFCTKETFISAEDSRCSFSQDHCLEDLLPISHEAFIFGRFNRDFNLSVEKPKNRYDQWLSQLHSENKVYSLLMDNALAGFIAIEENRLILHALDSKFRGQGLAKKLWTPVCRALLSKDFTEIKSSISATNLAAVNLYGALGFKFRNPLDIYHKFTP